MDALTFIDKGGKTRRQPYYVLSGDEDFLRRRALPIIYSIVLGDADPEFAVTTFEGESVEFSQVRNELDSVSFFASRRCVVIQQADPFVSKYRPQLEAYVAAPSETGVLVLDVKTFQSTTKLAKAVPEASHIVCKSPPEGRLPGWCVEWCGSQYGKKLTMPAAQMLVEFVGSTMGILDQELQKLKDYVGDKPDIEVADVDDMVGRSRSANVFKIMDAVGVGDQATALRILNSLFEEGEVPLRLLYAFASQLRKLAKASRLAKQGVPLDDAITRSGAGSWPKARDDARTQMKHLGWNRLDKLYDWLLETDSGLKGGNSLPERAQIERLIVRLAMPRQK